MKLSTALYTFATALFAAGALAELIEARASKTEDRKTWQEAMAEDEAHSPAPAEPIQPKA